MNPEQKALRSVNHIPAMVAYWDRDQKCVFANHAYLEWFGRTNREMTDISMKDLLGPLYEKNLPYILGALQGTKQVFERQIPLPGGELREVIATYTPDVVDGAVLGFTAHVADVTVMRERERALEHAIRARNNAEAEARRLRGLLPVCAWCNRIRDTDNTWHTLEEYVSLHVEITHGMCPTCAARHSV